MASRFWGEFKEFAVKGNAMQLAVAVVIGNAFTGVVNSLVGDIITPLLSVLTNKVDIKMLSVSISPDAIVTYGAFLQTLFNFLVVALTIFFVIKLFSLLQRDK